MELVPSWRWVWRVKKVDAFFLAVRPIPCYPVVYGRSDLVVLGGADSMPMASIVAIAELYVRLLGSTHEFLASSTFSDTNRISTHETSKPAGHLNLGC
jgi:hypothetical protein